MVGQGGIDHARHRALSVPVGPAVAVDRRNVSMSLGHLLLACSVEPRLSDP